MRFIAIVFFVVASSAALADLRGAIDAYNNDNFERAATEATTALSGDLSTEERLLAEEIRVSSRYFAGGSGGRLRDEAAALDQALADHYGPDAIERLGTLFILSDLHFQLGAIDAAVRADVLTARIALRHPEEAADDLIWALRNLAIAFDDEAADIRSAILFAALFEFFAVDLLGLDAPLAQEATAMSTLALLRAGEDTRAAQKFFLYAFEDWQSFATLGPDEDALATRLAEGLDGLPVDDLDAWLAEVQLVHDASLEREHLVAEIGRLVDRGELDFASSAYAEALEKMGRYVAVAHPEDPVTAIYLNMILKSHLDIGDYGGARPYLGGLLAYPVEYAAVLDLPLGRLAGAFSLRGGVDDALFEPLLRLALDLERIVPGPDPDLPFDLTFALARIEERRGRLSEAFDLYADAIKLGADPRVRRSAVNRAYHGAASVAADLEDYAAAKSIGLRLLDHSGQTADESATGAAYAVLWRAALGLGEAAEAARFAGERLAFERTRSDPDPAAIRNAEITLAVALLDADGFTPEVVTLLSRIFSGDAQNPEDEDAFSSLMVMVAERLQVTPESLPTSEIFASASLERRADLVAILANAAYAANEPERAIEWLMLGQDLAVEPSAAFFRLKTLEGRLALDFDETQQALVAFRAITDHRLATSERPGSDALGHIPFHIAAATRMATDPHTKDKARFENEAFMMAQLAGTLRAGQALNSALVRDQADSALRGTLRARQQVETELATLALAISQAEYDGRSADDLRTRQTTLSDTHRTLTAEIAEAAPRLADVTDFNPLDIAEVQAILRPEELLLVYTTSDLSLSDRAAASHVVALTRDDIRVSELPARSELRALADRLRCSAALTDPNCTRQAASVTRGAFSLGAATQSAGPEFDTALAFEAYQAFLSPVSDMLSGNRRLLVVADQALATLPVHLMLKAPLAEGRPLKDGHWLIRDHSVEIAPTVASLVALRGVPDAPGDIRSFLGIGDPLIGMQRAGAIDYPCGRDTGAVTVAALATADLQRAVGNERSGLVADLSALPDTRCELARIAEHFATSKVLLHDEATEIEIKEMSETGELRRFSVLNFATHGLIAGELGVNESGLVLTPPAVATARDDGILTTAEIAALELDADLVILSACNTASGDSRSDEGLSGLASAFFVAGAKSLMVSHWPVYSDAAAQLTTRTFDAMAGAPDTSRAEALRAAMLSILDDPDASPRTQHPSYWAPFMIVGDG